MSERIALFLCKSVSRDLKLFYAIDVPIQSVGSELPQNGSGFVHPSDNDPVQWERYRELGHPQITENDSLRFGGCVDIVKLHRHDGEDVSCRYLVPDYDCRPESFRVNVEMFCESAFDISGTQANLWLGAYSEMKYKGFMGTIDREFMDYAKTRKFEVGDRFLVEIETGGVFGVLELVSPKVSSAWDALLRLPVKPSCEIRDVTLVSIHSVGIDGFSVTFRKPFAKVVSVSPAVVAAATMDASEGTATNRGGT